MIAGGNGTRREDDFYRTPVEASSAVLPYLRGFPRSVWEPACGDGALSEVLELAGFDVVSTDLRDRGYAPGLPGVDFLTVPRKLALSIVTNPPFKLAEKFIRHARKLDVEYMALLLKINFWNVHRGGLFEFWRPAAIHPLTFRIDFTGQGRPTMDVAWSIWAPGRETAEFEPIGRN